MSRRPTPDQHELTAGDPAPAVRALDELAAAGGGWLNLHPEVEEDAAAAVSPSIIGALFRAAGPPIPQVTLTAPTGGRRPQRAQLGITHGVGTPVVRRLAAEDLPLPEGWQVVQDHVRRGLVVRLADRLDAAVAVDFALRAGTLLCPVPTTGRWLAEVHRP